MWVYPTHAVAYFIVACNVADTYPVHTEEWPTYQLWSNNKSESERDSNGEDNSEHEARGTRQSQ